MSLLRLSGIIPSMRRAYLDEVFTSIQGEGPHVGERQVFVRFLGCDLRCSYCDTQAARKRSKSSDESPECRVQKSPHGTDSENVPNPVESTNLSRICTRLTVPALKRPVLSLTGGEPLLQAAFLREWLPSERTHNTIYLETCGIHHEEMELLRDLVDIVSMDVKLPSATGLGPYWREHRLFIHAASGIELFVKAVVTIDTTMEHVREAATLVAGADRSIPLIIQPASGTAAPSAEKLLRLQEAVLELVADVRIIPQVHKMLKMP